MDTNNSQTQLDDDNLSKIYDKRFGDPENVARNQLWQTLCDAWMQRYINQNDVVLDLAAGRCEFINHIICGRKIAVDLNTETASYANEDVEFVLASSHQMNAISDNSVDIVFTSNFFEHLPTKQIFLDTLREIKRVLKPGGKLMILQPNIRFLNGEYWDFVDHYIPLTDRTLVEALELIDMTVVELKPRFLPYTTQSRLPQWSWIIRLYLKLPLAHIIFGKQAWVVATK